MEGSPKNQWLHNEYGILISTLKLKTLDIQILRDFDMEIEGFEKSNFSLNVRLDLFLATTSTKIEQGS